jgi:hypothetical protein
MSREVRFSNRTVILLALDFWHSTRVNSHDGTPGRPGDGEQLLNQVFFVALSHFDFFVL